MKIGYGTITWGGVTGAASGVTSVKDLFYRTHGDTEQALTDIAAAGYQGVEIFDGNLADWEGNPEVLLGWLASTGLELVSVYTGANFVYPDILEDEMDKVARAAQLARTFGARRLVVGGGAVRASGPAEGDFERLGAGLDRVSGIAGAHGLEASYHPHLGTLVQAPDALDRLMGLCEIAFCPDTAHLAAGGGDPAALIRKYGHRLAHVHLKDLNAAGNEFLPLGAGVLDFRDILEAILETGYDSWLMVELDSYRGNPREAAEISMRHLGELLLATNDTSTERGH
jgi:inosose dehydratase